MVRTYFTGFMTVPALNMLVNIYVPSIRAPIPVVPFTPVGPVTPFRPIPLVRSRGWQIPGGLPRRGWVVIIPSTARGSV